MNKAIYIGERQSYKTSLAIYRFMEDPENSLLITVNSEMAKIIKDSIQTNFNFTTNNIISPKGNNILKNFKTVIFDEFFFWNEDVAKNVFSTILPVIMQENSSLLIYTSLSNKFQDNLRQKLTLVQMKNSGWSVINLIGGRKTKIEEIKSWLFETPESKINEKTEDIKEVVNHHFYTNWRKTW